MLYTISCILYTIAYCSMEVFDITVMLCINKSGLGLPTLLSIYILLILNNLYYYYYILLCLAT